MEPDENGTCPDISVYMCYDKGMIMPFVSEYTWPRAARGTIYFFGLIWSFLGVAIIADVFMCAIEKITSKTRTIKVANQQTEKGYEEIEVKVWNDTVANLTLMALGSSAPEILLSIIEIVGNGFKAGALGPSTIVGSAAFNLLVITGVCVIAIKAPDTRCIKHVKVFAVTAVFSIFAYVWLIIILVLVTENYVDLWEAILTLLFFPILVILAYVADKDFCSKKPRASEDGTELGLGFASRTGEYKVNDGNEEEKQSLYHPDGRIDDEAMRKFIKDLKKQHHELTEEDVAKLASARMQDEQPHDRLWYRINATRKLGGSYKLTPSMNQQLHEIYESMKERDGPVSPAGAEHQGSTLDMSEGSSRSVVEFTASKASIMERDGRVKIGLRRYGKLNCRVLVRFETIDGTAEAEKDYIPRKETVVFEKDETYKNIDVEIIDDNEWEPDEVFFAKISIDPSDPANANSIIGKRAIMEITIINDDEPGTFEFSKPSLLFKESAGHALIPVERRNGADGQVTLKWKTEDMTATAGHDYEGGEGTLVFEHGETTKTLDIVIYDDQEVEKDETFKVTLTECLTDGAKIGTISKTIITIVNDDDFNGMVSRLVLMTNMNMDALRMDSISYQDQFRNAMNVNGGDLDGATHLDYVMHFFTFGWKIIFAIVPPPSIAGGWLAFVVALGMLAILTTIIGDLASIFGCLVGLEDSITAITFVALGTSLPDLFASKQAAQQEKTADACIGNVTGSNSVNVFLGLGLPWVISAIYWTAQGKTFYVPAGSLSFSVICYTVAAIICLGTIVLRRFLPVFGKAELGGNRGPAIGCCILFVFLWISYILLSSLEATGTIQAKF